MKSVLVGCEYSGTVRDAFRARGFDAYSNDLLDADHDPQYHLKGDVRNAIVMRPWDLIILHLECTYMAICGNKHYGRESDQYGSRLSAIGWSVEIVQLARSVCDRVMLENLASTIFPVLRSGYGADVQYIQPYQFGHLEQKKTGLALWNLPRLKPTRDVYDEMMLLPKKERERAFYMSPSARRGLERSRFYQGFADAFADAFADQWGPIL